MDRCVGAAARLPESDRKDLAIQAWLLLGSGVVAGPSRHQARDERPEQGFAAATRVVHELEEAEVERQLVLRDAAVRAEPGTQQRPKPLCGRSRDGKVCLSFHSTAPRCVFFSVGRQRKIGWAPVRPPASETAGLLFGVVPCVLALATTSWHGTFPVT